MTRSIIVQTAIADSTEAGASLSAQIREGLGGAHAHAVIVFASPLHNYKALLQALEIGCRPGALVGCSSAGEFIGGISGTGMVVALALHTPDMAFTASAGHGISIDSASVAREVASGFRGNAHPEYHYRAALVLTDALAGSTDALVEQLTLLTSGEYLLFGGGAGDDALFSRTEVFCGTESFSDAVVALEILSKKPIGVGVQHGWEPMSAGMRVTEADGTRLVSLDAMPALEAIQEHAEATGQPFDPADPMPFFLHNVLGIACEDGHRLRVPLAVQEDGSLLCAADIPVGATVHVMGIQPAAAIEAAARATEAAMRQMAGCSPQVALFFDCVATRLRMGRDFGLELAAVGESLAPVQYVGFNTYGQVARAQGQFSGFHNCTAVVCVLPS